MSWLYDLAYLMGGAFLSNGVPHFVAGVMGRPFQSPFAKPSGQGLSSSTVNVFWGCFNFVAAYLLLGQVGSFDIRASDQVLAVGVGILVIGLVSARVFGRFHGGNTSAGG